MKSLQSGGPHTNARDGQTEAPTPAAGQPRSHPAEPPDERQDQRGGLAWLDGDLPVSVAYDDPFYSRRDGRAECRHVFLGGNGLPQRWQSDAAMFVIAELGFGTGLNMLETWHQWRAARKPGQRLVLVSFERDLMAADDIRRALRPWPELAPLVTKLTQGLTQAVCEDPTNAEPATEPGQKAQPTIALDDATTLQLILGDARDTLPASTVRADAWFLDGFAPAKNPDMWSAQLMQAVFDRTAPGGTCATYTAAGWVRRNLEAAGFEIEKRPGHAGKREMVCGWRASD